MEVQAASAASNHETKGGALNTDIWFLMFKALVEDVENSHYRMGKDEFELYAWLRSLRLLSRDFNTIITPLVYADISLTNYWRMWWLIDPYTSDYDAVKENIFAHTKAFTLTEGIKEDFRAATVDLISKCKRLNSVAWNYCDTRS